MPLWTFQNPYRHRPDTEVVERARKRLLTFRRSRRALVVLMVLMGLVPALLLTWILVGGLRFYGSEIVGPGGSIFEPMLAGLAFAAGLVSGFSVFCWFFRTFPGTGTSVQVMREDEVLVSAWETLVRCEHTPPLAVAAWRPVPAWLRRWSAWWPWLEDPASYVRRVRENLPLRRARRWRVLALTGVAFLGFLVVMPMFSETDHEATIEALGSLLESYGLAGPVFSVYLACSMACFLGGMIGVSSAQALQMVDFFVGGSRRDRLLVACWDAVQQLHRDAADEPVVAAEAASPSDADGAGPAASEPV